MAESTQKTSDIREQLRQAVAHFEHLLPGQAPIRDFVHHNTLHGYEHLHFTEALEAHERLTGARGYLTEEQFRAFYQQGRIREDELIQVLDQDSDLHADPSCGGGGRLSTGWMSILPLCCIHSNQSPPASLTGRWKSWRRCSGSSRTCQRSVVTDCWRRQRAGIKGEEAAISDLWSACLQGLGLTHYLLHPEELVDLSPEQAERMLAQLAASGEDAVAQPVMDDLIRKEAGQQLDQLLARVGDDLSLLGLLRSITGHDLLDDLRPGLQRQIASYLDQGVAAWHDANREQGFYAVWRRTADQDLTRIFGEFPGWNSHLESLPDDPMETLITELRRLGLPQYRWVDYLKRLALELPGWSGMFLWRDLHPGYEGLCPNRVEMIDYLAVRLVLEHLFAQRLCAELWQLEASIDLIRWYFRHHSAEFLVRYTLYSARLPEYLATLAQRLTDHTLQGGPGEEAWWQLAQMVRTWSQSPAGDRTEGHSVYGSAWRLFRLSQHMGLCGDDLRRLDKDGLEAVLDCLERLTSGKRGFLWLQAYELHYRNQLFNALADNQGREPGRIQDPTAQLVFCMDDREEGLRRHLEEIDPSVETFGAAAHFSVPNYWRGIDDTKLTPLCPVVVTPSHEFKETPRAGQEEIKARHSVRRRWRFTLGNLLHQEIRRNLFSSALLTALAAPGALLILVAKVIAPLRLGRLGERLRQGVDLKVDTEVTVTATDEDRAATPERPRLGFTELEQVDRVETLLRNIGLIDGFAPLVVIMAHGSSSQNNPHLAAYDCGACSGRHSGPNARIFATMANRPEVRDRVRDRGISIPEETWFLGAEHNTCSEAIEWYDLDVMPEQFRKGLSALRRSLDLATRHHAHERCRRLASAPRNPTSERALAHIQGRALDFSQARPELGHATNAAAFVGRRSMSRGTFLDRRVFLISYDPTTDPTAEVLERLLLANAPVGAGINLEYYFSTVDNDEYGSGSKVTHNLTGLFGVMDGASSDLRTGLPRQMIEIHEAMRLQVVVEASVETLTEIYGRQPALQELIGNGWLLLSAMDPDTGAISVFDPKQGFLPWGDHRESLPRVDRSVYWYRGHSGPLAPALVTVRMGETNA